MCVNAKRPTQKVLTKQLKNHKYIHKEFKKIMKNFQMNKRYMQGLDSIITAVTIVKCLLNNFQIN